MANKKNIIQDAIADAKAIEKYAIETAKKTIEESLTPQIEQAIINSIRELEEESFNSTIEKSAPIFTSADIVNESENQEVKNEGENVIDNNSNIQEEMNIDENDEIFEISGVFEDDAAAPVADPSAMTPAAGAPAPEGDLSMVQNQLTDLSAKIDSILSAVNPGAANPNNGEGEVQVVDDDNAGSPPQTSAPAPAPASAPGAMPTDNSVVREDDLMFEFDDEMMESLFETDIVTEDNIEEIELSELDSIDEIEIVDEDDQTNENEEQVDEMRGMSHTVQRSAGNRQNFEKNNEKHAPIAVNESAKKIKAQYESKIDGLIKENKSLKNALTESETENTKFKNAFTGLRQQVNDMQVFNGKLAYANKLLSKGGITNEEVKMIAEQFDRAQTVEEAKKLYNKLDAQLKSSIVPLSENKVVLPAKQMAIPSKEIPGQSNTIFESEDLKRRKILAGITKREY